MALFRDRADAGRKLADDLVHLADSEPVILALPRGGVPVAFEVARTLHAPLDVFTVRKVGAPGHEELAMGAIASGGVRVQNEEVMRAFGISDASFDAAANDEQRELMRRESLYRKDRPMLAISGRTVVLIDDGLATGSTMRAAVQAVRQQQPARVVIAVPVAAESTCRELGDVVDEIICHATPRSFGAVGAWYDDFTQTTDQEVHDLLQRSATDES